MSDRAAAALSIHTLPLTGASTPRVCQVQRVSLVATAGPDAGAHWTSREGRCSIGTASQNDIVLSDPAVSRFHCELAVTDRGIRVRDLESRNGTHVGGVAVRDAMVQDGQLLSLGRTTVRVVTTGETETVPVADGFGILCGRSESMRRLFAQLERVAASRATVLLEGETGTGKTAAAESVHLESERKDAPFIVVDCGAVPPALLESELLGHERGAFTGAGERRKGAFEAASGGTLFLDEIGELPIELQPKLLRVLESRTVKRVGSNESIPVDVRVIAATNRDLRTEVNAGRFRPDLYYRLAVVTLRMPGLRERPDDLPDLLERILADLGARPEARELLLSPPALARLQAAPWPGNVRELRNHVERCVVLQDATELPVPPADGGEAAELDLPYAAAREQALERFERRYVARLLARSGGQVAQAAREAGLNRTYLHRLIGRHRIAR